MTLTAMRTMKYKPKTRPEGHVVELPVAAGATIYSGGFIGLSAAGYAQLFTPSTVATTLTGFDRYIGLALQDVDNSAGAAGALTVKVLIGACFYHAVSGLAVTDVGAPVFISDHDTLTKVALGNPLAGWVERFEASGYGMIRSIDPGSGGISPIFSRWTPSIETVAANIALLIHPTENQNGLLVTNAFAIVTEVFGGDSEDQGVVTLQDTAGTTLGITFTPSNAAADAEGDLIAAGGGIPGNGAATGIALVPVPAGLGVQAKVTQLTSGANEAGAMKVYCEAVPVA